MKTLIALVVLLCAAPAEATVYAFRCTNWPMPIEGYLDTSVGSGKGFGAMYVAGQQKHWWITGFDSWWHGPFLNQDGYHQALIIHPDKPWIMGMIYWQGPLGRMDIFSANGDRFEFDFTVEVVIDGEPDDKRSG